MELEVQTMVEMRKKRQTVELDAVSGGSGSHSDSEDKKTNTESYLRESRKKQILADATK